MPVGQDVHGVQHSHVLESEQSVRFFQGLSKVIEVFQICVALGEKLVEKVLVFLRLQDGIVLRHHIIDKAGVARGLFKCSLISALRYLG